MRVLFVAGPTAAGWYPMVPLAQAVRLAGHEVFAAGHEALLPQITDAGLAAVAISSRTLADCGVDRPGRLVEPPADDHERELAAGRMLGRFAAGCLDPLIAFARDWRPDRIVGVVPALAAPLAAHEVGVPYVRFATDLGEPVVHTLAAVTELGPELEKLGLYELPEPWLAVSVTPPSLRPADACPALPMRHVPYETQVALEPWMYAGARNPRIVVSVPCEASGEALGSMLAGLAELDAELVVTGTERVLTGVAVPPGEVRLGRAPLAVLVPTADLVVHRGFADAVLTCVDGAVPQLVIPADEHIAEDCARLAELGAAQLVRPQEATAERVGRAARQVIEDASVREAARRLREEAHQSPPPSALAARLTGADGTRR